MRIEEVAVGEIKAYDNNPRRIQGNIESVMNSLKEFGWQQPIVIDKEGVIVAGHVRFEAAKQLGYKTVPCVKADDLTDEQIKAYRIADNKTSEIASWDYFKLGEEVSGIDGFNLLDFGFSKREAEGITSFGKELEKELAPVQERKPDPIIPQIRYEEPKEEIKKEEPVKNDEPIEREETVASIYKPTFNPSFSKYNVTEEDIEEAEVKEEMRFIPKPEKVRTVTCPCCGREVEIR